MMNNNQCPIVRDLLPSCVEQLCSTESEQFIQEHMAQCEECAGEYAAMREAITTPQKAAAKDAEVLAAVHKTYRSIRVRTLVIAVAVAVAIFIALSGIYSFLQSYEVPLPASEVDLFSMAQAPDGEVYFAMGSSQYQYSSFGVRTVYAQEENALYYHLNRSLRRIKLQEKEDADTKTQISMMALPYAISMDTYVKDGRMYTAWGEGDIFIDKIYIGSEGDFRLVWQTGQPMPVLPQDAEVIGFYGRVPGDAMDDELPQ